jgi:putative transposase
VVSGFSRTWLAWCPALAGPRLLRIASCAIASVFPKHPEHLRSFDYQGPYAYFLTFCTDRRRHVFVDAGPVNLVRSEFLRTSRQEEFGITAYCFMPDHVHLLVEGASENADLRRFVRLAKQLSGFHYKQAYGSVLWQRYGFERVLRGEEPLLSVARYILSNPIRAGLCRSIGDYPFLGSETHTLAAIAEALQMQPGWHGRSG